MPRLVRPMIAAWFLALLGSTVIAADPDRAAIHDIQQGYWDSITIATIVGEEFVLDSALRRKEGPAMVHQELELIYGSGGRLSFRRIARAADGSYRGSQQFREDGSTKYGIVAFPDDPDAIDDVFILNQTDRPGRYEGDMCIVFWAWMPGGRPVHRWLEDGATLATEADQQGRQVVVLTTELRHHPLRIYLDPDHDWLPARVEMAGSHRCEVRSFARDQGHWFPAEVAFLLDESNAGPNVATREGFQLKTLTINGATNPKAFGMPLIPDGVHVSDQRNWSGYFKGGHPARKKLEEKHGIGAVPKPSPYAEDPTSRVVAAGGPSRFPWEGALAAFSAVALGLSWKLRRAS